LKVSRLIVAIIGLAALGLAYFTGSVLFLVVAVVAFIGGLYLMGANKKPVQKGENASEKSSKQ
jgi:Na+/proline symporter